MRRGGMTGDNLATHENPDPDPKRSTSRLDSNALIQGLERLRECVEQRLSRLEAVARERAAQEAVARERAAQPVPVLGPTELEHKLQKRIAEYEEAQLRLR